MAAPRLRLALGALALLTFLVAASARANFVFPEHKADRAGATVAGELRQPPVKRKATRRASVGKVKAAKAAAKAAKAAKKAPKAEKKKPRGRIVRPKPGMRKRAVPAAPPALNDPLWTSSWSLTKVNAPAAWQLTTGSPDTIVAVLDTGVDLRHPDLEGAFVPGYDFVNHDEDASDDHGHGTMVAGVVAARANNGIGGSGTCSRCSVMPIKVIGGNGSGNAGDVATGVVWAADHGADVINLSFVLSGPDDGVAGAIAYARSRGAVVVAAAGNAGSSELTFPAGLPGVVSVTGTDGVDVRYGWANHGSWVRLAAPGCSQTTAPAGAYGDFCGTSSAAAFVSGLVGLARSLAADAPGDAIADGLAAHAVPVGSFVSAGRVDAAATLAAFRPAQAQPAPAEPSPPPQSDSGLD